MDNDLNLVLILISYSSIGTSETGLALAAEAAADEEDAALGTGLLVTFSPSLLSWSTNVSASRFLPPSLRAFREGAGLLKLMKFA